MSNTIGSLEEIKQKLTVFRLWTVLNLPGEPKRMQKSPFRDERSPSFSIYKDGTRWKDFGTGEGGDIFDFWERATGKSKEECFKELAGLAQVDLDTPRRVAPVRRKAPMIIHREKKCLVEVPENNCVIFPLEIEEFFTSRGISLDVAYDLLHRGEIELEAKKLVFNYNTGKKMRGDLNTSKMNRWLSGNAENAIWGYDALRNSEISTVILTEGETDRMVVMSNISGSSLCVASIPAASWDPNSVLCEFIGRGRRVILAFDNDLAGRICTERAWNAFSNYASDCEVAMFPWSRTTPESFKKEGGKDLTDLRQEILLKLLALIF